MTPVAFAEGLRLEVADESVRLELLTKRLLDVFESYSKKVSIPTKLR